jgi:hypothetical protein
LTKNLVFWILFPDIKIEVDTHPTIGWAREFSQPIIGQASAAQPIIGQANTSQPIITKTYTCSYDYFCYFTTSFHAHGKDGPNINFGQLSYIIGTNSKIKLGWGL